MIGDCDTINRLTEEVVRLQQRSIMLDRLLFEVARKFPSETRFDTALRYIREAELKETDMEWIPLTKRMPNPEEHDRVLIYTRDTDFDEKQVFDVDARTLNSEYPGDMHEVCKHATHWAVRPDF